MKEIKISTLDEFETQKTKVIEYNGKEIAIFKINETFFAIDERCSHRGGPLSEGLIEGTQVTCRWHGAKFDLINGRGLCPPAHKNLQTYEVFVKDNSIFLKVDEK